MVKILLIGSTKLSQELAVELAKKPELEIVGIITGEKDFRISYSETLVRNYNFGDLASFAEASKIPFCVMNGSMNDHKLFWWTKTLDFDCILVAGWYHMIPKNWLEEYICLGVHASLLPNYRGGAPLVWALINGESETGVSLFVLDSGVDTGKVLAQVKIPIASDENIATLLDKVTDETVKLCLRSLPNLHLLLQNGTNSDSSVTPVYPQRAPVDGKIQLPMSSSQLLRFVRAQTHPYPGAYLQHGSAKLYLWECVESHARRPYIGSNQILFTQRKLMISCTDGLVEIKKGSLLNENLEINDPVAIYQEWKSLISENDSKKL